MADRTSASIIVAAPMAEVMAVIADFPAYPQWASAVRSADIVGGDGAARATRVRFQLDAGTGPINVNLKDGADVETKKPYDDKVKIGMQVPGELVFGELRLQTPRLPSGERTTAFTAVEKIVPANGSFFAPAVL